MMHDYQSCIHNRLQISAEAQNFSLTIGVSFWQAQQNVQPYFFKICTAITKSVTPGIASSTSLDTAHMLGFGYFPL